ncbi:Six-hairpin glycosidase-like protein [Plectosphaerella plurivora]|uniref:Six-hairpin glycosidase-like protein n=1 Tax=Plectosphaerella plurivora TaxID=936078 RepID=A0A9P8VIK0_9PEZI|nr:Six-hairpin glycosidase-like protein [Plectosphaerella plurivora]
MPGLTLCATFLLGLLASQGNCSPKSLPQYEPFLPKKLALGSAPSLETAPFAGFTLESASNTVATVDYGHIVAGVPWFEVSSLSGPVQLEIKYTEEYGGLEAPFSDGPFLFGNQMGANFRVETLNMTKTGKTSAFLVQGGQRWQSVRLLTDGSITFKSVGFEATFPNVNPEDEPGQFTSDNERLNAIWKVGVRGAESSCIEQGTQPATWRIDPENGALVTSLRPIQSDKAPSIGNNTLEFETKIERGGLWWGIAWGIGSGGGIGLQLTGELPKATTFENHNYTLSPRNSLQVTSGWGQVNQTTLPTYLLKTFDLPFSVQEKTWYKISTTLDNGYLSASIDGTQIFNMSLTEYRVLFRGQFTPITLTGRFGLGAYQDQEAYYRNVSQYDQAGALFYHSDLTSAETLLEYGVETNIFAACLDGPKRDRLIWLGDYYHTARIVGVSTARFDLQKGTFDSLFPTQLGNGMVSMASPLGYEANTTIFDDLYALEDYQLLGLLSFYYYVRASNDLAFVRDNWAAFTLLADWAVGNIDTKGSGLTQLNFAFTGPGNGSSVNCMTAYTLHSMSEVAEAIGDTASADRWTIAAEGLTESIQEHLWNEDLGVFSISPELRDAFSVTGTAFCISGKVATPTQTTRSIEALDRLATGPGYIDSTQADPASPTASYSPNTNGFLLSALFEAGEYERGAALIDTLWGPMVDNDRTSSGASWEYVLHDGTPGLGLFTSLGHPWGGAATYVLTEWAAGLRAASGVRGFGFRNWVVGPEAGVQMGLGHASARVVTAFNGTLQVDWTRQGNDTLKVVIEAPKGTSGTFEYVGIWKILCGKTRYELEVAI